MREQQEIQMGSSADSGTPQGTTGATIPPASPSIDSVGQAKVGLTSRLDELERTHEEE